LYSISGDAIQRLDAPIRHIFRNKRSFELEPMPRPKATSELYTDFKWGVDSDGYLIVPRPNPFRGRRFVVFNNRELAAGENLVTDGESWLAEHPPPREVCERGGVKRYYQPMLEETGLWREFAESCVTEEAVLKFVTKYGLPFDDICSVAEVIEKAKVLRKVMEPFDRGRPADAIEAFNAHARASMCVLISDKELRPYPEDLYSALLLQAGQALTGNHKFKRCGNPDCTAWLRIGTGAATKRRRFCGARCRVAASRLRATEV
jgi:hypothetical protein